MLSTRESESVLQQELRKLQFDRAHVLAAIVGLLLGLVGSALFKIQSSVSDHGTWPIPPPDAPEPTATTTLGDCGNWQADYARLHADILAGRAPQRYAVAHGDRGLADSMKGAVSVFYYAVLTKRAFLVRRVVGAPEWITIRGMHELLHLRHRARPIITKCATRNDMRRAPPVSV
jgi:hypothetical protein